MCPELALVDAFNVDFRKWHLSRGFNLRNLVCSCGCGNSEGLILKDEP